MDLQDLVEVLERDREEDQRRGGRGEEPELEPDQEVAAPAHTEKGKNEAEMTFRARQQRNRSKSELSGIDNPLQLCILSIYQWIRQSEQNKMDCTLSFVSVKMLK
jgi:hypothetical protein